LITPPADWRPGASLERLRQRAAMLAGIRQFFSARSVLEVDTPQLVNHAVTEVNLHSAQVRWPDGSDSLRYLHTSAEYAMKRLLAAGTGDIYQLCHVFRGEETGPLHNSEFMMLEWYRLGWPLERAMSEVDELLRTLLPAGALAATAQQSYQQVFQDAVGCDPLSDSDAAIAACARDQGFDARLLQRCTRDDILDLLMGARVGPQLGQAGPLFLHRYPASQAALACLDPRDPRVALRFELYYQGVELANGFEELADEAAQRDRFEADRRQRAARGRYVPDLDEWLLAALAHGLPACSGVALGVDRLLMLASSATRLAEVMAFTTERA
jgi:elongation factor P--(R)-beta-lysine ligase